MSNPWGTFSRFFQGQRVFQLETGKVDEIELYKQRTEDLLKFFQSYYWELASQRAKFQDQITLALSKNVTENFTFINWQRGVHYKYSNDPLSTLGSLKNGGGRFNIGDIDVNRYPMFPALYLAADKDTSLQEHLGQVEDKKGRLSARDIALTNPNSETIVAVTGTLDQVIDIRNADCLREFVEINSQFTFSDGLLAQMKTLGVPDHQIIKSIDVMQACLLVENWKHYPMMFDIPANPQVFGQLVMSAGIQGIVYPSKLTSKSCLAIFPDTFKNSSSFVELSGELLSTVNQKRIDGSSV